MYSVCLESSLNVPFFGIMRQNKIVVQWERNLKEIGLLPEVVSAYKEYISKLVDNNVPIIFDFEHLCLLYRSE